MKKQIFFILAICFIGITPLSSQGLLKKVTSAVKDELLGTKKSSSEPEPACACNDAEQVIGLGGNLNLTYNETNINFAPDGSMLLADRMSGKNYILKDGQTIGPLRDDDPRLAQFKAIDGQNDNSIDPWIQKYKGYISKTGEKYQINFGGKTYGPYGQISNFVIPMSNDKFAALVIENLVTTESEGKQLEAAIENAKTDQEKMELAMKYSQQMAQKMLQGGGPESMTMKLISNIPDASYDISQQGLGVLNGTAKYDDIVIMAYDKVYDLQGKEVMVIKPEHSGAQNLFINTANTKYAVFNYGSLLISDGTTITCNLLNVRPIKTDGKVYLAYMYYSPKKNAIMQCKIPW